MDDSTNLGYYYCFNCNDAGKHKENPNQATCDICGSTDCVNFPHGFTLNWSEIDTLSRISTDKAFILSMDDLKKHDVIEFNVKMAQFKTQTTIQQHNQSQSNLPHCPKCGSTSISTGARGVNYLWGFIGASKTVNRCSNCGYTWKPKR